MKASHIGRDAAVDPEPVQRISNDERFGVLVEGVTEYAVFLLDERGHIVSWNRGAERAKHMTRGEVFGQHVSCLYMPEDVAAGLPDAILRSAAEHGTDVTQGWRLRRDGSCFWASVVTTALYDDGGRLRGYLKIVRDETARHAEDEAHEATLRWMRMITESCPVGLLLLEAPDAHCMWANRRAAELLGLPAGPAQLEPRAGRLLYPDGRTVPLEQMPGQRALVGETIAESEEFLLRRADGSTLPILASAAPVLDSDRKITGAVAAFDDVSAVKRVEQRREQWTAVVAHDLRQPLGAIVTSVGLLTALRGDEARMRRVIDLIVRNARRLDRMIRDLVDVSWIESGQMRVESRPVDLEGHVRAAADRAAASVPDRRVLVRVDREPRTLAADPDRLDQILDNLLTNAMRYGDPGSDVTVTIAPASDGVAVAVTNRGPGIARQELPQLFRPFQRDTSAARVRGSIGLGLYITKGLVEAHGGHIEAESTPGKETTFRFVLPAAA